MLRLAAHCCPGANPTAQQGSSRYSWILSQGQQLKSKGFLFFFPAATICLQLEVVPGARGKETAASSLFVHDATSTTFWAPLPNKSTGSSCFGHQTLDALLHLPSRFDGSIKEWVALVKRPRSSAVAAPSCLTGPWLPRRKQGETRAVPVCLRLNASAVKWTPAGDAGLTLCVDLLCSAIEMMLFWINGCYSANLEPSPG